MRKLGKIIIKTMVMRGLIINNLLLIILCVCLAFSCVMKKNFYNEGQKYCLECCNKYANSDTVKLSSDKICVFKDGNLEAVGTVSKSKRVGYWYIYKHYPDKLECSTVILYKDNDSTVVWRRSLINESW